MQSDSIEDSTSMENMIAVQSGEAGHTRTFFLARRDVCSSHDRWPLDFSTHRRDVGLRLAPQCRISGDAGVRKQDGFRGQGAPDASASAPGIR